MIMTKLEIIKKVIHEDFLYNQAFLEEKQPTFRMKIKLSSSNAEEYLVYRFNPESKVLFPFFSIESNLRKICDYIVLFEKKGKLFIIISELKRGCTKSGNLNANRQLKASELFLQYIIKSANRIGFPIEETDCRLFKVRFSEDKIDKRMKKTSKNSGFLNSCGDDIFEYLSDELQFIDFR